MKKRSIVIFVLIIGVILFLTPLVAVRTINWALSHKIEDYDGHIKGLDYRPDSGTLQVIGFQISDRNHPENLQFDIDSMDVNINWRKLLDKKIHAKIYVDVSDFKIAKIPDTSKEPFWPKFRKRMIETDWEIAIDDFELHDGWVQITVPKAKDPLVITYIRLKAKDLIFSPERNWKLSPYAISAFLQDQGEINIQGSVFAMAEKPAVDVDFSIVDFDIKRLNGLLLNFMPADITKGNLSIYAENATQNGESMGYAKIFLDDIDVVASPQKFKSGRHVIVEAAAAVGNWALKNKENKSVAMVLPYKFKNNNAKIQASDAFWSSAKNKFDTLPRKIDQTISFETLSEDTSLE